MTPANPTPRPATEFRNPMYNHSSKFARAARMGLLIVCGFMITTAHAAADRFAPQRKQFLQAEAALKRGDRVHFWELVDKLRDYPLYPYLRYEDLRQRLGHARRADINAFLDAFADTPLAPRLRGAWLDQLADHKQWAEYLHAYRPSNDPERRCRYRRALLATGQRDKALSGFDRLWLTGRSLPDACDPVIAAWQAAHKLTPELAWDRIHLAMTAGNTALADYLGRYLPGDEQHWVKFWHRLHHDPLLLLTRQARKAPEPLRRWFIVDGVTRLARADTTQAADMFAKLKRAGRLNADAAALLTRRIALRMAYRGESPASDWLARVPPSQTDAHVRAWRVRAALARQDWAAVQHWIEQLEPPERTDPRWQYWLARALEAQGHIDQAKKLYREVAADRTYEGFLAADRIGQPYHFEAKPLHFNRKKLAAIARLPGIERAHELLRLGRDLDARREWRDATRKMNEIQLQQTAKLAEQWGWHDRAILTLARSSYRDDLTLRFPLAYRDFVMAQSRKAGINPAWAFAVIRRESAFNADARSIRGAIGLMQLLPSTARRTARAINRRLRHSRELYKEEVNVRLGIAHLKMLLDRFGDHPVLATAAYNAGGYRVQSWLPSSQPMPADVWIETVPFTETRNYLRSVLAYTAIYERRMGRKPTRLEKRMSPIAPRQAAADGHGGDHG